MSDQDMSDQDQSLEIKSENNNNLPENPLSQEEIKKLNNLVQEVNEQFLTPDTFNEEIPNISK